MRILLMIKNFDLGGAESHVFTLANELARRGHFVYVISKPGRQVNNLIPAVQHIPIRMNDISLIWKLPQLLTFIRREEIEVIHAHQRLAIYWASLLKLFTNVPVIATIHGRIKSDLRSYFSKMMVSKVVVISKNSLKGAKSHKLLAPKSTFIANGVLAKCCANIQIPDSPTILYASRLDRKHSELITLLAQKVWPQIIRKYPFAKLKISGDGPFADAICAMSEKVNDSLPLKSIFCKGFSQTNEANLPYASLVIGTGRTAIEAMAKGVPVLSVHTKHIGEVITPQNYGDYKYGNFVNLDGAYPDEQALFNRLDSFLKNRCYYWEQSNDLKMLVQADFSVKVIGNQVLDIYKELQLSKKRAFSNTEYTSIVNLKTESLTE